MPQNHLTPSAPPSPSRRVTRARTRAVAVGVLTAAGLALAALPAGAASGGSVNLVAYSTPKPAYAALVGAFAETSAGAGVSVSQSYGPSGTQATDVVSGLPADLVNFSLPST